MCEALKLHIRWMIRRDMPEVVEIESHSFEFPWSENDFITRLRQRNCIGMVVEHQEQVIGFMVYNLQKKKLEIADFAVHKEFRRQGVGMAMVEKLKGKLNSQRRNSMSIQIRETNLDGQLFFKRAGFLATTIVYDAYEETSEDAYLMEFFCG